MENGKMNNKNRRIPRGPLGSEAIEVNYTAKTLPLQIRQFEQELDTEQRFSNDLIIRANGLVSELRSLYQRYEQLEGEQETTKQERQTISRMLIKTTEKLREYEASFRVLDVVETSQDRKIWQMREQLKALDIAYGMLNEMYERNVNENAEKQKELVEELNNMTGYQKALIQKDTETRKKHEQKLSSLNNEVQTAYSDIYALEGNTRNLVEKLNNERKEGMRLRNAVDLSIDGIFSLSGNNHDLKERLAEAKGKVKEYEQKETAQELARDLSQAYSDELVKTLKEYEQKETAQELARDLSQAYSDELIKALKEYEQKETAQELARDLSQAYSDELVKTLKEYEQKETAQELARDFSQAYNDELIKALKNAKKAYDILAVRYDSLYGSISALKEEKNELLSNKAELSHRLDDLQQKYSGNYLDLQQQKELLKTVLETTTPLLEQAGEKLLQAEHENIALANCYNKLNEIIERQQPARRRKMDALDSDLGVPENSRLIFSEEGMMNIGVDQNN